MLSLTLPAWLSPLLVALLWQVQANAAAAPDWRVDQWRAEQGGLPQNNLQALQQSQDGYLWITTWHGVARFDGVRFTLFDRASTSAMISDSGGPLAVEGDGAVWVGTSSGLVRLGQEVGQHYGRNEGIPFDHVTHLLVQDQHGVWCGGEGGVARFTQGRFRLYTAADGLTEPKVRWLLVTPDEGVAVASPKGIQVFNPQQDRFIAPSSEITPGNRWLPVSLQFNERLTNYVAATETDLQRRGADGWHPLPGSRDATPSECRFVAEDRRGGIWFQRRDGPLRRWEDGAVREIRLRDGPIPPQINSFCEDREGNIWLAGQADGLFRLTPLRVRAHTAGDGLVHDSVSSVTEARDGSIWAGTDRGAGRYHGGRWEQWTQGVPGDAVNEVRMRNNITSVCGRRDGSVWLGTWGRALQRWESGRAVSFGMSTEWMVDYVTALYEDSAGAMWVSSGGRGVIRMKGEDRLWLKPGEPLSSGDVTCMLQTRDGAHWFGTKGGGLNRWHEGRTEVFAARDGLIGDAITVLHEDADGVLWIGTNRGLARREQGRFTAFTTREGMFDDMVNWLLEDDYACFWISCNRGIARIRRADLNAVAAGRARTVTHVPVGEVDGMASAETNGGGQPAGCKSRDGRLWFPTVRGVVEIDPRLWQDNTNPPPVILERIQAVGEPVKLADSATLPPGSGRVIEFHYTATSLTDPTRIRFRCRLKGHDAEWQEMSTRRVASYTNLRPGNYRFQVTACNHHGYWNPQGATFAFIITPYYYETNWFLGACAGLVLGGAAGIHGFRLRVARRFAEQQRQHSLELERARIARDLHDNLGAGLSQVALLGELASQSETNGLGQESLARLAEQARAAQRSLNEVVWVASARHDTVAGLLNYLADYVPALLGAARIPCLLDFPLPAPERPLAGNIRHEVFLIIKEALNNVVRHAMPER
ncbi:MAG: two-component regulator propeller domain-containing protein [Limisphaerales bacterium]